ncbi:MAG: ABC transporter permease [Anaerostipes sp.]|jgi:ABC-2 type transport system permease protein
MRHLMKYRWKEMIRRRDIMFWAIAFPMILGTLFSFAFSNGKESEAFHKIPVAVVTKQDTKDENFALFLKEMNGDYIKVKTNDEKKALKLLKSGDIKGIYYNEKELQLAVTSNGMEQSILETLMDAYEKNRDVIIDVAKEHPEKIPEVVKSMEQSRKVVKNVSLGGKTYDEFLQYYFALIAMACMFGAFLGMANSMDMQANITQLAARRCIAPVHRIKMIISDMVVVFFMHFINVCVLLLYLRFILKIEIGNQWPQMILVAFIGSMIGVSLGTFIGAIGKMGENIKVGILIGVSLLCSFLAGLMVGGMKNIIDQYIPIVNRLNPAALIADAFYSMSVYADPSRFITDILFMTAISGVFIIITFLLIRRERYDSI